MSKKEGFKIDLTETASVKKRFNNYVGINASIKKKKLEIEAKKEAKAAKRAKRESEAKANTILNQLLEEEFTTLGIKYEQVTWDATKNKEILLKASKGSGKTPAKGKP